MLHCVWGVDVSSFFFAGAFHHYLFAATSWSWHCFSTLCRDAGRRLYGRNLGIKMKIWINGFLCSSSSAPHWKLPELQIRLNPLSPSSSFRSAGRNIITTSYIWPLVRVRSFWSGGTWYKGSIPASLLTYQWRKLGAINFRNFFLFSSTGRLFLKGKL